MKPLLLASTIILACSHPHAAAQSFAILAPGKIAPTEDPAARETIARATAVLGRPPGAIPRLHTEGTLPGKGIREISLVAKRDQAIVLDLALAWRLTGERRYLDQTARYLEAWADIYQMSFNPIDETGFDLLILATDLAGADLSPALGAKLDRFWRAMAKGYLDAMDRHPQNAHTNWQSHRVKLATMAAFQTGDAQLVERARAAFRKQIGVNVRPDGSVFDFEERDALHYVTYDLNPLLMAALAAEAHNEDWYRWKTKSGASLGKAVAWLDPYATGARTHVEFANSKIRFDRERAAAGQSEYAPHRWDRANGIDTFALAALLDPRYAALRDRLVREIGQLPPRWLALMRP